MEHHPVGVACIKCGGKTKLVACAITSGGVFVFQGDCSTCEIGTQWTVTIADLIAMAKAADTVKYTEPKPFNFTADDLKFMRALHIAEGV